MKERATRVLVMTSEMCNEFGLAWEKGIEYFTMVGPEDVIQLMHKRQPEKDCLAAPDCEDDEEMGLEVGDSMFEEMFFQTSTIVLTPKTEHYWVLIRAKMKSSTSH